MKFSLSFYVLSLSLVSSSPTKPWTPSESGLNFRETTVSVNPESILSPLIFSRTPGRIKCSPAQPQQLEAHRTSALLAHRDLNFLKRSEDRHNGTDGFAEGGNFVLGTVDGGLLSKRVMTVPNGNSNAAMDEFLIREVEAATAIIYDNTVSTALFRPIKGTRALSFGLSHLCGCTSLAVYSKTAVYFGHYYENLVFDPDPDTTYGSNSPGGYSPDLAFQNIVEKGLRSGIKDTEEASGQDALAGRTADFGPGTRALLIIPSTGPGDVPDPYRSAWNKIEGIVKELVPGVQYREVIYNPLDAADPAEQRLDNTARGKMLFQYDPQDPAMPANRKSPTQLIKIWSEYTLVDTWAF